METTSSIQASFASTGGSSKNVVPVFRIEPQKGWASLRLHELWEYRELLYNFVWRDFTVRYKHTVLGAAWAIIVPFFTMMVFSLFFGKLGKIPSDGVPYPIFSYTGLLPWTFFAHALQQSSGSLVSKASVLTKVYFPRLTIPIAAVLSGLVDFLLALSVLFIMMLYYGITPTINSLWLPLFLLLALISSLGIGLWLCALNVAYRDVRHILPFIIQFWMFGTPVAYPSSLLSEPWRTVYAINPMVGVVEGFRWALLGVKTGPGPMIAVSALAALALLISGIFNFKRMEKTFADIL